MLHRLNPAPLVLAVAILPFPSLSLAEAVTSHLQINGFATAGGSWVSKDYNSKYLGDPYQPGAGVDEKGSYQQDSVLGVQFTYAFDDRFDMVGQIVAAGTNDFQAQAEWAYVGYRVNDNLRIRAGRFAAPWYMYTENSRVGQAYPWARLPVELYKGIPINSLDGFDFLYRQPLGEWNLDAQVSVGGAHNSFVRVANNTGLNLNLINALLSTARMAAMHSWDFLA